MEDEVDAADSVDSNGNRDMERDGGDDEDKDEEKNHEDEAEEVEEEEDEEKEDEDEEADKDEDDDKEPRTLGQRVMVNTSGDEVDTIIDDQPIVLPQQGQEMCQHIPWPQPPARHAGGSPMTMNYRHSSPQWAGAFEFCDPAKTSPRGAESGRN